MERLIFICLLLVGCCQAVENQKEQLFAKSFLEKYQYVDNTKTFASADDAMTTAITDMQVFAGLLPTGKLDQATVYKMHSKRCGNPDRDADPNAPGAVGWQEWPYTDLTYRFHNFSPDLGKVKTRSIIKAALKVWSDVTPLTFTEIEKHTEAHIDIMFMSGRHTGCNYPFDGQGGVLAHAFFPRDGRSHFDEDETFTNGTTQGVNLFWVAAHEFGHALGLSHSSVRSALMYPYYTGYDPSFKLPQDDITRIQALYGSSTDNPRTKGPTPAPTPSPAPTKAPCVDKSHRCPGIEDEYCEHWKDWMRANCPKKCGYCGGQSTEAPTKGPSTVAPTRRPPTGAPTKGPSTGAPTKAPSTNKPCKDEFNRCDSHETKYCRDVSSSWENWMRKNCAKYCNFCGGGAPTKGPSTGAPTKVPLTGAPTKSQSTNTPCQDKSSRCDSHETRYCRDVSSSWENWMRKNCAKRCNFC